MHNRFENPSSIVSALQWGMSFLYNHNVFEFTSLEHFLNWISRGLHLDDTQGMHHLILDIKPEQYWTWRYPYSTRPRNTEELVHYYKTHWWPFTSCTTFRAFGNLKSLTFILSEADINNDLSKVVPELVDWIKGILEEESIRDARVERLVPYSPPNRVHFRTTLDSTDTAMDEICRPITDLLRGQLKD